MPILLKRKNGEITPFRNAEYIFAFYFIPKSILDKCGEEINSIPRNPRKLLRDPRAIEVIEGLSYPHCRCRCLPTGVA